MNPYHQFISEYARLFEEAKGFPLGTFPKIPRPAVASDAPKALIFSPHPDDEVIVGALPLQLLRKSGWQIMNVAVTLGSKKERQSERLAELRACCDCIGFGVIETGPDGLENVTAAARKKDPVAWSRSVKVIADILAQHQPRVIFVPHKEDWHTGHVGTHWLVSDALKSLPGTFQCFVVETEFWQAMDSPNLMVEVAPQELGDLVTALTFHVGEVKRNPYHLSLPAWMVDNVRRGAELIGGQRGAAPNFTFATLYRLRQWTDGKLRKFYAGGKSLGATEDPATLFKSTRRP